jgi:hypothetical protein
MSEANEIPMSRNLGCYECRKYWVTAAEWNGIYGSSYEIGIREKEGKEHFFLIQHGWNERTVKTALKAVGILLDAGFTPDMFGDLFQ